MWGIRLSKQKLWRVAPASSHAQCSGLYTPSPIPAISKTLLALQFTSSERNLVAKKKGVFTRFTGVLFKLNKTGIRESEQITISENFLTTLFPYFSASFPLPFSYLNKVLRQLKPTKYLILSISIGINNWLYDSP